MVDLNCLDKGNHPKWFQQALPCEVLSTSPLGTFPFNNFKERPKSHIGECWKGVEMKKIRSRP
jgi:hypothetical protein